jgi:extracellular elastinolytic metalloproteinase
MPAMKKDPRPAYIVVLASLMFALPAYAQNNAGYQPRQARTYSEGAGRTLTAPSTAGPASIVAAFLAERGVTVPAASLVRAGDPVAAKNGITVVRLEQIVGGLRLYGVYGRASLTARGELVHLIENLVPQAPAAVAATRINEAQALNAALARLYPGERLNAAPIRRDGQTVVFERTPFFHDSPTVTRVAFVAADGSIRAGLLVDTWSERENLLHHTLVGADGAVLFVEQRTSFDAYRVFVEDPGKGDQQVVQGPGAGNAQSPQGWLFAGSQSSIHIEGNNAQAYLDADADNRPDEGGAVVANGEFLTEANLAEQPTTPGNSEVAVQNLFYLNNVLHDTLYQHGFTESAGNFQHRNFGLGGRPSDSVRAEAQDGGGTDNANFATPPDGRNPRMQMFLWSGDGPTFEVVVNSPISDAYGAAGAQFGPAPTATGITGDVVLVDDGVGTGSDGCEGAQAAVSNKIALIDRGACDFTTKVLNAQMAGAIAVIVANNQGGDEIATMGGVSRRIQIPAVMISQNDGAELKGLVAPNATVHEHPNPPLMLDGSLDSDIVYHEYGHGLTWRMIGGMSGPLAGAIGEGAADGLALLFNGDDKMGEYASGAPNGIRRDPYAGYPRTYGDVTGLQVHADGEIYAAVIWRLIELFTQETLPIATLFDYFVDGMNFTPATPAYEDMRDGILQSVANSLSGHDCLVWEAFAQFGIGVGADGAVNGSAVTITESFDVPAMCTTP